MIKSLNALRFIFALCVFFSHIVCYGFPANDCLGEIGVSFFFVCSGFVLAMSEHNKPVPTPPFILARRQWLKSYPLHFAIAMLLLVMQWVIHQPLPPVDKVALHLLLLQGWVPSSDYQILNAASWYLCAAMFHYVMFPYLYRWINRSSSRKLTASAVLLVSAVAVVAIPMPIEQVDYTVYMHPVSRLVDFVLGIMAFRTYMRYVPNNMVMTHPSMLAVLGLALPVVALALYPYIDKRWAEVTLFQLTMPAFVLLMALCDGRCGWLNMLTNNRWLQSGGQLSLHIFLLQLPVQHVVSSFSRHVIALTPEVSVATGLVLTIAASVVAKKWFCTPLYRRLSGI